MTNALIILKKQTPFTFDSVPVLTQRNVTNLDMCKVYHACFMVPSVRLHWDVCTLDLTKLDLQHGQTLIT